MEEVKKYIEHQMQQVPGLKAVFISDKDGVPVFSVVTDMSLPDIRPKFFSTASLAIEQANKMGLGKNKHIVAMYEKYQAISFNHPPLMITMIASVNANTGMMINIGDDIKTNFPEFLECVE